MFILFLLLMLSTNAIALSTESVTTVSGGTVARSDGAISARFKRWWLETDEQKQQRLINERIAENTKKSLKLADKVYSANTKVLNAKQKVAKINNTLAGYKKQINAIDLAISAGGNLKTGNYKNKTVEDLENMKLKIITKMESITEDDLATATNKLEALQVTLKDLQEQLQFSRQSLEQQQQIANVSKVDTSVQNQQMLMGVAASGEARTSLNLGNPYVVSPYPLR